MRGTTTPAHGAVSNVRRIPSTQAPGAHAGIDAGAIVRLPLMIGRAIAPADRGVSDAQRSLGAKAPGAHAPINAGVIVRRA